MRSKAKRVNKIYYTDFACCLALLMKYIDQESLPSEMTNPENRKDVYRFYVQTHIMRM